MAWLKRLAISKCHSQSRNRFGLFQQAPGDNRIDLVVMQARVYRISTELYAKSDYRYN